MRVAHAPRMNDELAPPRAALADTAIAWVFAMCWGAPPLGLLALAWVALAGSSSLGLLSAGCSLAGWMGVFVWARRATAAGKRRPIRIATELGALVVLPLWGLLYSHATGADCTISQCSGPDVFRPFAEPEVFVLAGLHGVVVLAYAVSRRRPDALPPVVELVVHSLLVVGIAVHTIVAIHVGPWLVAGFLAAPVLVPCLSPVFAMGFFLSEVRGRLRMRANEARAATLPPLPAESVYRVSLSPPTPRDDAPVRGTALARLVAGSTVLAGLYAVMNAAWLGEPAGALSVVTRTCGYTLSRLPIVEIPADCHYLCTVAARGHASLVRPIRVGRRGGIPILVNRQLAIANAFEDLLHERWPRFGAFARKTYDALGLPVSRLIRSPWAADAVFIAMKPAEWLFYLVLLLLDRRAPEARIDRMYR